MINLEIVSILHAELIYSHHDFSILVTQVNFAKGIKCAQRSHTCLFMFAVPFPRTARSKHGEILYLTIGVQI